MQKIDILKTVTTTIQSHELLDADVRAPLVLMVSGGSDSVALLRLFAEFFCERKLTVLHINHLLRGEDSDADERFVVELAARLGLPCEVRRIDVAALAAEQKDNVEQTGRNLRYQQANGLLDDLCSRAGVDPVQGRIVTAHTLDDRVETFFMRCIVGAGASALASIPYRSARTIRPLLDLSRVELQRWLIASVRVEQPDCPNQPDCSSQWEPLDQSSQLTPAERSDSLGQPDRPTQLGQPGLEDRPNPGTSLWREDASNADTSHLRAFVRHELIPLAQTRNPELLKTVARSLDNLALDDSLLAQMAQDLGDRYVRLGEETSPGSAPALLTIDTTLFREDEALIRRVIHQACKRILPGDKRVTAEHIADIAANGSRVGFVTNIPGALTVVNEYGTLVIWREEGMRSTGAATGRVVLKEGCPSQLPDGRMITLQRVDPQVFLPDSVGYVCTNSTSSRVFIDGLVLSKTLEETGGVLEISPVEDGDCFCPLGMNGQHKLVSDLLIDQKVPRRKRHQVAKVSLRRNGREGGEEEIIWIVGVRLDDRFKVSEETTSMFSIIINEP